MELVEAIKEIARISMNIKVMDYVGKCLSCGAWYSVTNLRACPGCGSKSVLITLDGETWKKEAFERWNKK